MLSLLSLISFSVNQPSLFSKDSRRNMLVILLCFDHHKLQHLLLNHLHKQFHLIGIDPVQIRSPPVRNRTIPVLLGLEKGKIASSFWNEGIPDPDQIGFGDGCISGCGIETGWRWSRTAFPILDNQHILNFVFYISCLIKNLINYKLPYVGYRGWFAIWGDEAWNDGNKNNGDGWKQIGSGLRSGSPSSFWICSSSVSPCFGEQSQFLLELEQSRSGPDRSRSVCQKWGNGIKEWTEGRDGGSHPQ